MSTLFAHHQREKLVNAIAFFAAHTKHCGLVKSFKLLNLLDFEHYRQTGKSVTGMRYQAMQLGPVPTKKYYGYVKHQLSDCKKCDTDWFSPRELTIMKRLVEMFKDAKSKEMIAYSHRPKMPWRKIYGKGEGVKREIPYELALQGKPIVDNEPTIDEDERLILQDAFDELGIAR